MKRMNGLTAVNDDEWYTSRQTADKVAAWLVGVLPHDTTILCPADILPDGTESTIPLALRAAGFTAVRVTRDLPVDRMMADWREGEVVVTNPPFSLLTAFRHFLLNAGARYCVLSRPGWSDGWNIPSLGDKFKSTDGRRVAAAWFQNIADTSSMPDPSLALGDCAMCEHRPACPRNAMTGDWHTGRPRPLFGWCVGGQHGILANQCHDYTVGGKWMFSRFFYVKK